MHSLFDPDIRQLIKNISMEYSYNYFTVVQFMANVSNKTISIVDDGELIYFTMTKLHHLSVTITNL